MTENNDYSYLLDIINLVDSDQDKSEEEKISINFEGDFLTDQIKNFNINLVNLLAKDNDFSLSINEKSSINQSDNNLPKDIINNSLIKTDINIQHFNKSSFFIPKDGHWISINNWKFGSLPKSWLESINDYLDSVWVASNYSKNCYIESGIKAEKIQVVNYGTDSLTFNPHVEKANLNIQKKIKFIYKGNLDWESGFDILLKAYTEEFSNDEDICLIVVSDEIDENQVKNMQELASKSDTPEIMIIERNIKSEELAKMYAQADFLVSPHRVESFCTNIVDSMACGIPAIVANYGAVLDYCNEDNALLVKTEKVYQSQKNILNVDTIDYPYWGETQINSLRVALRKAYDMDKNEYDNLAKNVSKSILDKFTYVKVGENVKQLIKDIIDQPIRREVQEKFNNNLLKGLNYLTQGDYNNSLVFLNNSLEILPDNENVNFYLSNLTMAREEYHQAFGYLITCLQVNPQHEDYNNLMGVILYKIGDYKLAEGFFKRTLEIMSEHGGAKESLNAVKTIKMSQFDNKDLVSEKREFLESLLSKDLNLDNQTLSVCILTKNEEANIERAIKSVRDIADEIIILDTGSTDKTIEIAQNLGVKIFSTKWQNNFAIARNEAISHANMDWILMLDADEYLELDYKDSLKPILKSLDKSKAYQTRIINFLDKNNLNEKIEHYVVRLTHNHQGIKYIRSIHEYPVKEDNSNLETEILNNIKINHSGYLNKKVKEKDKIQRNRNILLKAIEANQESIVDYFYLAENYKEENNYDQVLEYSEKVIALESKYPDYENMIKMAKMNIIEGYIVLKEYDQALEYAKTFESHLNKRPDYWFLLGSIKYNKKEYDQAIEYNKKALTFRDENVYPTIDIGTITWKPLALIAESYMEKNDFKNALVYYKRALKEDSENLTFYIRLTEIYSKLNNLDKLETTVTSFIHLLNSEDTAVILERIYKIYLENNSEDRLYKLLEVIRHNKLSSDQNIINEKLAQTLINIYTEILNKHPDMSAVKYSLACCYDNLKNYDKAEEIFQDLSEEGVDSLHNLASMAFSKNDLNRAELLYKKVIEKDEFHVQSYISLVKLEIKKGDQEKANFYIDELKNLDPDNKQILQLQFEIAKSNGDQKLASDMYASMLFRGNYLN